MDIQSILEQLHLLVQQTTYNFITIALSEQNLKDIERRLNRVSITEWPSIRTNHIVLLTKLKINIEYLLKEPTIRANNRIFIGFRDRFSARLFEGINVVNERKIVTNIFNEFVRGITYFTTDPPGTIYDDPIYHRDNACPPNNMPNLVCDSTGMTPDDIKKRMYTCYVERLIYDEIWLQIYGMQQNSGHLDWLLSTKKAFQKCFPHTTISVFVRIIDSIPDNVIITIEDTSNIDIKNVVVEHYEKNYSFIERRYDINVSGTKMLNQQVVEVKNNTCYTEGVWQQILQQVPGGSRHKSKDSALSIIDAIIKTRSQIRLQQAQKQK